ncbi:MAG: hypothetical protein P4L84_12575 [Isosphaeraceae bacterium]|nr:hypothetical protein [Isosphaeraceae bacterium]
MDVADELGGVHGKCKHCGHHLVVPVAHVEPGHEGLRLRSAEEEPPRLPGHLLASEVPLIVRPAEAAPRRKPEAVSRPDEDPAHAARQEEYALPEGERRAHSSAGPPPLWVNLPTLTARFMARHFRSLRDWLYLVSVGSLVIVLLGYLYHSRVVLHLGAVLVVASNISMLVVGIAYLVTLPFKESLWVGLANLFVPFYAFYYWSTRWHRMKRPVLNTLGSFLPIALVGLAYLAYEEAPVIEKTIETELPIFEKRVEQGIPGIEQKLDQAVGPVKETIDQKLHPDSGADPKNSNPQEPNER